MAIITTASASFNQHTGKEIKANNTYGFTPTSRQELIEGFEQSRINNATLNIFGAGGYGGETGSGFARKGFGAINIFDGDDVEITNLNRQLFYEKDLGKNKAICLAKNILNECVRETVIRGYPYMFEEALALKIIPDCDVSIFCIDSKLGRKRGAKYCHQKRISAIFSAVSKDANHGYTFIQRPDEACFGCAFPDEVKSDREPCPGAPAMKDIIKVMCGIILFAVDSLLMPERNREWNLKQIFLDGSVPDSNRTVERNEQCIICGDKS